MEEFFVFRILPSLFLLNVRLRIGFGSYENGLVSFSILGRQPVHKSTRGFEAQAVLLIEELESEQHRPPRLCGELLNERCEVVPTIAFCSKVVVAMAPRGSPTLIELAHRDVLMEPVCELKPDVVEHLHLLPAVRRHEDVVLPNPRLMKAVRGLTVMLPEPSVLCRLEICWCDHRRPI